MDDSENRFKDMYVATISDLMGDFVGVVNNDGLDETGQVMDLAALNDVIQVNALAESPQLRSYVAKQSKIQELVAGHEAKSSLSSTLLSSFSSPVLRGWLHSTK